MLLTFPTAAACINSQHTMTVKHTNTKDFVPHHQPHGDD